MTNEERSETRETVERLVRADPTVSAADIAREAGVSRQRAHVILSELGYELKCEWRKRRKPGK